MSVIKKCCVCDGTIVNGRCEKCGMPYQEKSNFYHLNEDRREHVKHMSAQDRQAYEQKQMSYERPYPPVSGGESRPQQNKPQTGKKNNGWIGIVTMVVVLLFAVIPLLIGIIFD